METIKNIFLVLAVITMVLIGLLGFVYLFSFLMDYDLGIIEFSFKKLIIPIGMIIFSAVITMKLYQEVY